MTPSPTRAPFVVAAAVAAVPLLVLAAAAPGGNDWRWLELPRHITLLALATGLVIAFRKNRTLPVMVPIVVVALALAWELVGEYLALRKFGRTDLLGQELDLLFSNSVERLAPWLTGTLYGILAYLAIARSRHARTNLVRAGVWLVSVGAVAVALTLANESWLTLENLGQRGTFRSSVAWPDTKKLSLVAAALAITAGLAAVVVGRRPSRSRQRASFRKGTVFTNDTFDRQPRVKTGSARGRCLLALLPAVRAARRGARGAKSR